MRDWRGGKGFDAGTEPGATLKQGKTVLSKATGKTASMAEG